MVENSRHSNPNDLVSAIPANLVGTGTISLDVVSYAGYATITKGDHMFYWLFESQNSRLRGNFLNKIPLVIWLNGGPGASSLTGLFMENGPYLLTNNDTGTIVANPNTWNEEVHLLYWDQPLGTGFSYSEDHHYVNTEKELSALFVKALQLFFQKHPEYQECPLYIAGESYAGKYIPFIATQIMNNATDINLTGLMIGDGWMKPILHLQDEIDFAFAMGFLDIKQKVEIEEIYETFCKAMDAREMKRAFDLGNQVIANILACAGHPDVYDVRRWKGLSTDLLSLYLNQVTVKKALGVPESVTWQCSDDKGPVTEHLKNDNMADMTYLLPSLVQKPYKMLFYTGNFDMTCGYTGTENILHNMQWKGQSDWQNLDRTIWIAPSNKTLGYYKSYKNLTHVMIVDTGHLVPMNQPLISREMIFNWIFDKPFYTYTPELIGTKKPCEL